jgi:transposase-like protein
MSKLTKPTSVDVRANMHDGPRKRIIAGRGLVGKVAVDGLLDRHGKGVDGPSQMRVTVVPNVKKHSLRSFIKANVAEGSRIYTDDFNSYRGLHREYIHSVINHAEEYVRGNVHTNGCENFWSLLKRALKGTYVSVERSICFATLTNSASGSISASCRTSHGSR